jgi:hypothetical protein
VSTRSAARLTLRRAIRLLKPARAATTAEVSIEAEQAAWIWRPNVPTLMLETLTSHQNPRTLTFATLMRTAMETPTPLAAMAVQTSQPTFPTAPTEETQRSFRPLAQV